MFTVSIHKTEILTITNTLNTQFFQDPRLAPIPHTGRKSLPTRDRTSAIPRIVSSTWHYALKRISTREVIKINSINPTNVTGAIFVNHRALLGKWYLSTFANIYSHYLRFTRFCSLIVNKCYLILWSMLINHKYKPNLLILFLIACIIH